MSDLPPGCQSFVYPSLSGEVQIRLIIRIPPPGSREEGAPAAIDLHCMNGPAGRLAVVLSQLRPSHVILFEPHVAWVREVEVFAARQRCRRRDSSSECDVDTEGRNKSEEAEAKVNTNDNHVTVYFMLFKDSVEEQRYLTNLRRVCLTLSCMFNCENLSNKYLIVFFVAFIACRDFLLQHH